MSLARMLGLCLLLALSGCQYIGVQSSQLNAVMDAVQVYFNEASSFVWTAQFGGYVAVVKPLEAKASTIFANDLDIIRFDGWNITKVRGLDNFTPAWEIQDLGSERSFFVNGHVVEVHQCEPWVEVGVDVGVRFEQQCTGTSPYTNMILVDTLGQITNIEQVVDSSLMVLSLRLEN